MITVGLTGGIASGKSTVAELLREKGAAVLDADLIAREVVQPGEPAWNEIVEWLGADILTEGGYLDRDKLGKQVFNCEDARLRLNSIVHPRVAQRMEEKLRLLQEEAKTEIVVKDIPLLIESDLCYSVDAVLLVWVPLHVQYERLRLRDGLSSEDIRARMKSQMSLEEKKEFAHYIIDNGGSREHTRRQVDDFWRWIYPYICHAKRP